MAFIDDPELEARVLCDLCGGAFTLGTYKRPMFAEWKNVSITFDSHLSTTLIKDGGRRYIQHACTSCRTIVKEKFEVIIAEMRKVEVPNEPS
jgi:hypothetical protein